MNPRVKTAAIALPIFLGVLFFGGVTGFALVVAAVAGLGTGEYLNIAGPPGSPLEKVLVGLWAAVVVLGFLAPTCVLPVALLSLGVLLYVLAWVVMIGPSADFLPRWGAAMTSWLYVGVFLGSAVLIRGAGIAPVLFVLAVVWAGDTAAYYVGSALGSRQLAPAVSPNKSVEGAAASLVAAAGVAFLLGLLLPLPHGALTSGFIGVTLNLAAQLGDLGESLLKRCAGVKDSGQLLPGHGGVLDRVDAFLPTLPVYAAYLAWLGPVP